MTKYIAIRILTDTVSILILIGMESTSLTFEHTILIILLAIHSIALLRIQKELTVCNS
jgi:hypothetical protein